MSKFFISSLTTHNRWGLQLLFIALFLATVPTSARAEVVAVPALKAHVTDLTATLSTTELQQLEQQLSAFEAKKGSQIVVLMVPTTHPESIEQFSMRAVETWRPGRKGIDDGVLLLVAKNDRTVRIEIGYGLEGALPDALARRIIDEAIAPRFRQGDFFRGLQAGIQQLMRVIAGEPLPEPVARDTAGASLVLEYIFPILIIALVLGKTLQTMFGRTAGATITSTVAGALVWLISTSLAITLLIGIAVFVISLFDQGGNLIHRSGYRSGHWPRGGSIGGGLGGGFRGGGGGGGFGGGGASGRW